MWQMIFRLVWYFFCKDTTFNWKLQILCAFFIKITVKSKKCRLREQVQTCEKCFEKFEFVVISHARLFIFLLILFKFRMQVQYFISRSPALKRTGKREMKYCTCIWNLVFSPIFICWHPVKTSILSYSGILLIKFCLIVCFNVASMEK